MVLVTDTVGEFHISFEEGMRRRQRSRYTTNSNQEGLWPANCMVPQRFRRQQNGRQQPFRYRDNAANNSRQQPPSPQSAVPGQPPPPPPVAVPATPRNWKDHLGANSQSEETYTGPIITSFGTICVILRQNVRVDMTLDKSIRVVNFNRNSVLAINSSGTGSCLVHPTGRVYQNGSKVEVETSTGKFAKMSHRGITFTFTNCPLVYLVDDAGTRSTIDTFNDSKYDNSLDLFYASTRHGNTVVSECFKSIDEAEHRQTRNGDDVWFINGIKVVQNRNGDVWVSRENGRRIIKTSPMRGTISVSTPLIYASASSGQNPHIFARRGERRLHSDNNTFVVRNGTHSAGFDEYGRLVVY